MSAHNPAATTARGADNAPRIITHLCAQAPMPISHNHAHTRAAPTVLISPAICTYAHGAERSPLAQSCTQGVQAPTMLTSHNHLRVASTLPTSHLAPTRAAPTTLFARTRSADNARSTIMQLPRTAPTTLISHNHAPTCTSASRPNAGHAQSCTSTNAHLPVTRTSGHANHNFALYDLMEPP